MWTVRQSKQPLRQSIRETTKDGEIMKLKLMSMMLVTVLVLAACGEAAEPMVEEITTAWEKVMIEEAVPASAIIPANVSSQLVPPSNSPLPDNPNLGVVFDIENLREIYLAGGCFWGVEAYMSRIYGVYDVTSGYANGSTENPTYMEVIGGSGHAETVHVLYDSSKVSLETLLDMMFEVVDPTSLNKQGNDRGIQYRSGVYYTDEADLPVIEKVIEELDLMYSKDIVVEVLPLDGYYLAEEYHQDYLEKNPDGYCHIEFDAIEDQVIMDGDAMYTRPSEDEIRAMLTDLQYYVTQEDGTERAFDNKYWDNKEEGIYVDIVSGEPLFSSATKYVSGTGWPSFWAPIDDEFIQLKEDNKLWTTRVEVRSTYGDSHLGHVFKDGPSEHGGLRYCMNSASLRFIPYDEMDAQGYGAFKELVRAE